MIGNKVKSIIVAVIAVSVLYTQKVYAEVSIERLFGEDRYRTCVSIAKHFSEGQLDSVIVTSGNGFADALSGSNLQILSKCPVLTVDKTVKESRESLNYIQNSLKKEGTIYILGEKGSVSSEFEKYFKEKGFNKVIRLGGQNRYETNIKIVDKIEVKEGTPVVIANGENFPDALSISSIAAYKGYPIFLTENKNLSKEAEKKIKDIKPSNIYIVGGDESISNSIEKHLKETSKDIIRIEGKDRYETSINICKHFDEDLENIVIASGENFPDALSGTALACKYKSPIVITNDKNIDKLKNYLSGKNFKNFILLGGEAVLSKQVEEALVSKEDGSEMKDLKLKGEEFVNDILSKNLDEALKKLSSDLKQGSGEKILKGFFSNLNFNGLDSKPISIKQESSMLGNKIRLTYKANWTPVTLDIDLKFDKDGQIYDMSCNNTPAESKYKFPTYVDTSNFYEKDVVLGEGKYKLPAVLSIPKGKGPFPAVVLVHGSGASDKDETYGDTKIFKDISAGLASKGIAVLRYDKRAKEYSLMSIKDTKLDLNKETINDAVDAVKLLKTLDGIDSNKIFVLGHSQGAMLTPSIIKECGDKGVAGGIMMAGPVDFLNTLLDQSIYLSSIGMMGKPQFDSIKSLYDIVSKNNFPQGIKEDAQLFGLYPYYWTSVKNSNHVKDAKDIKYPLFILQGKRDYQVNASNLDKWKEMLQNKKNVDYISYDKLNHFFIEGEGKMTPEEYGKEDNIPDYVINDIYKWIADK